VIRWTKKKKRRGERKTKTFTGNVARTLISFLELSKEPEHKFHSEETTESNQCKSIIFSSIFLKWWQSSGNDGLGSNRFKSIPKCCNRSKMLFVSSISMGNLPVLCKQKKKPKKERKRKRKKGPDCDGLNQTSKEHGRHMNSFNLPNVRSTITLLSLMA